MPRGRHTALRVELTTQDRLTLEAWQRATSVRAGQVRRGRVLLLLAEGCSLTRAAAMVGIARRHIYKWVARFHAEGLAGLCDRPRRRRDA